MDRSRIIVQYARICMSQCAIYPIGIVYHIHGKERKDADGENVVGGGGDENNNRPSKRDISDWNRSFAKTPVDET